MINKDILFNLVHSMSRAEKKYFSRLLKAEGRRGKKQVFAEMFRKIDLQKVYNEEKVYRRLQETGLTKHPAARKHYLFMRILGALNMYYADKRDEYRLGDLLNTVRTLISRRINAPCFRLIREAKKIAGEKEWFPQYLEAMDLEYRVRLNTNRTGAEEMEKYHEEGRKVTGQWTDLQQYRLLETKISSLYNRIFYARSAEETKAYRQVMEHPQLGAEARPLSFNARLIYYRIQAIYSHGTGDTASGFRWAKKQVELFETDPQKIANREFYYCRALYSMLIICINYPILEEFENVMRKIRAVSSGFPVQDPESGLIRNYSIRSVIIEFDFYSANGFFEKCILLAPEAQKILIEKDTILTRNDKEIIHFSVAYAYFGTGAFSEALKWINRALNELILSETAESSFRMLDMMIHFEIGNFDLLESSVRSAYRFLFRRQKLYPVESILLKFLRSTALKITDPRDIYPRLPVLKQEMEGSLQSSPGEEDRLQIDFIPWLDAKITGRPFAEIVREAGRMKTAKSKQEGI